MSNEKRDLRAERLAEEAECGRQEADEFPYGLVETTGERALGVWQNLRTQGRGTPLVLGGYGDIYRVGQRLRLGLWRERGETAEALLEAASHIRFPEDLFAMRASERAEMRARVLLAHAKGLDLDLDPHEEWPPRGPWPARTYEEPPLCVATQWDFTSWDREQDVEPPRVFLEKVYVALLAGADATEAPAHLHWGSWNYVPRSEMLVAALRSWRDRYGAELAGISHDTWSLRVDRTPTSRQEALALAEEMVALCGELLGEVKTLEGQAALVMANEWWNFWWD